MSIHIRPENTADPVERLAIHSINQTAFGGPDEAMLVDSLRRSGHALLSLVAESGGEPAGHILFSRMWIDTRPERVSAVALAPVAVLPARQRQGIGSSLIRRGLQLLKDQGERIVIVVGHPNYYPRFGFSTAVAANLASPFPREAFMAMELAPHALDGIAGAVVYPEEFGIG